MPRQRKGRWEQSYDRRTHKWCRLTDEQYDRRFQLLRKRYHPAVAAVMAHEEPFGIDAQQKG